MVRLSALLFIVQVVLVITALISCLSAERDGIRALPRLVWALVILLFPLVGPIAWFLAGRPVTPTDTSASGGKRRGTQTRPSRPLAPDDDPEFLRSLDAGQARQDRQLLDQWEADLRRREEEQRRREKDRKQEQRHPEEKRDREPDDQPPEQPRPES